MPTTRALTQSDIDLLEQQGVDTTEYKPGMQVQVLNDDEAAQWQQQQRDVDTKGKGRLSAIASNLRQNMGAIAGGGAAGTAAWGAAAELAPATYGMSLIIPALAAAGASWVGSRGGDILQHKVVEPTLGETPERQQEVAEQAESARRVFPGTSMATDITAGALAGGGLPSTAPIKYASKGLVEGLKNEGVVGLTKVLRGATDSPVYNQAIQNVITGNALNTAINTGIQLATTGKVDPTEVAGAAVGGALFAQPSRLGKYLNPSWHPVGKPQAERPSIVENIDPSGENIAKVQAYQKSAKEAVDALQVSNQEEVMSHQQQEQEYNKLYEGLIDQETTRQKNAEQAANWTKQDDKGSYLIPDRMVKTEYVRRNRVDPKTATTPAESAMIQANNQRLTKVDVDQMRQSLYDTDVAKWDPERVQREQAAKAQEEAKNLEMFRQMNQQLEAAKQQGAQAETTQQQVTPPQSEAPAEQPKVAAKQEVPPVPTPEEQAALQQQINAELGQKQVKGKGKTIPKAAATPTPQAEMIMTPNGLMEKTKWEALQQKEKADKLIQEGKNYYQEGQEGNRNITPQLLQEAGKHAVDVGAIQGKLVNPATGNEARGVTYDYRQVGRRLIGLAEQAGGDTGYHELVHQMLKDLRASGNPQHKKIADAIVAAYGGEEPAAEAIGQKYQKRMEVNRNAFEKLKDYMSDVMVATRTRGGTQGSAEDLGQNLVARMSQRHGKEGVLTQKEIPAKFNRFSETTPNGNVYAEGLQPALRLPDGTIVKGQNHGEAHYKAYKQHGVGIDDGEEGFFKDGKFYTRDQAKTRFGIRTSTDIDLNDFGDKYQDVPNREDDVRRYGEIQNEMRAAIRSGDNDQLQKVWQEMENIKNRYKGMPPTMEDEGGNKYQEIRFKPTQAAVERIPHDIPTEDGKRLAGAFRKTLQEKQNLLGKWWNPIAAASKGVTREQQANVRDVLLKEVNDKTSYRSALKSSEEQHLYDTIREKLLESAKYRQAINEPVYRDGVPTKAQIDPHYYPTTVEPKVSEAFRKGTDHAAMQKYSDDFIAHQKAHGYTDVEAKQNLKDMIDSFQGSAQHGSASNQNYFNAARQAQGTPLPESWQRQDLMRNLEAYHRRLAADVSYYHNVESDHKTMASLGYTKDPWRNVINEPTVQNIHGNNAVQAVMGQLKGEHANYGERTTHAGEALATTLMLGPLTEIHKAFSSLAQVVTYASNPVEAAKTIIHAAENIGNAWTKVMDTGYVQLDAAKARDMLDTNVAAFERLRGMSKLVRNIYTANGLTEHFTKSFLHAAGEYTIPAKVEMANAGDKAAQQLLKHLDPDYVVGKDYKGNDLQLMASEFANLIHGSKDARTLPSWMLHDNEISAFFKLSSWNIAQTNNFFRNVVNPLKEGNIAPLLMTTLGVTLGGAVIKELREAMASKKSPIPSMNEIINSTRGVAGNKAAVAYNWMAMASYAGFAGILSQVMKVPFDYAFKNAPGGATFPLDEVTTNTFHIARNVAEAILNDPNVSLTHVLSQAVFDWTKQNVQFMRIGVNHMADNNMLADTSDVMKKEAYSKQLADKMAELRRYKMVEGLPYESQDEATGNPYMFMKEKAFKREGDVREALKEVRPIVTDIVQRWANQPEVMLAKLRGLKQMDYETMPSLTQTPLSFARYVRFLNNSQGPEAAQAHVMDYLKRETLNQAKAGFVP